MKLTLHTKAELKETKTKWRRTHAAKPSYLMICRAQSSVLLYLCASRPFGKKRKTLKKMNYNTNKNTKMYFIKVAMSCTCILVLTTSSGVFPNTLAAPAMAPNVPVTKGFMGLLGSSPGGRT